jgi:RHS repeat-associated protein
LWRPVCSYTADSANPGGTARWTKRQFDHNGHTIFESYPKRTLGDNVDGVTTQYDALGRVSASGTSSESGMLWTTYGYLDGFQKSVTDPKGHVTTSSYQAFDAPSDSAVSAIAAPLGVNVGISRDIFGKTTSITRSGGGLSATRSYVYDAMARLCKTIEPETGATVQDYDAANNVTWRASGNALASTISCDTGSVAPARKVTFGYDVRNRLASTSYADGSPSITRTYTNDGLPYTITSNGSVWTNTYNNRRLNTNESLSYGGANYNIARAYDANGALTTLTYPDGVSIAHSPNALGQPTQVGGYASAIAYYPNGAIASFTYGNGVTHTLAQNTRGLPIQSTDSGVLNDSYTYDANDNVASITDQPTGTTNRTMGYDDLDRLISVSAPNLWGNATYTYDALDNLRTSILTDRATARTLTMGYPDPATNRLMSTSGGPAGFNFVYNYDLQGNITQRGSQSYVFDQGNRMTSAAGRASYAYDGLGHRISVVGTDGVNRVQVYSQGGQLLYTVPSGSASTKYIYMHNHMLAEVGPGGVQYDHTDALGSPVARTDGNRTVISQTRYEPYGYTAAGTVPGIGFTGHVNDADTGLVYMQQRYYDPVAGRFLSIDPVVTDANTGGSFNRYNYANNNPYRYIDPDGRDAADKWGDVFKAEMSNPQGERFEAFQAPAIVVTGAMLVVPVVVAVGPTVAAAVVNVATSQKGKVAVLAILSGLSKAGMKGPNVPSLPTRSVDATKKVLNQIKKESNVLPAKKPASPPPPPPEPALPTK